MKTKISYNSKEIASIETGRTATLACKGKMMESNVVVECGNEDESPTVAGILDGSASTIRNDTVTRLRGYAFNYATHLTEVYFPKLTLVGWRTFNFCSGLTYFDGVSLTIIDGYGFEGCTNLKYLFIRQSQVCVLASLASLGSTPFASGGSGGTVYVPRELIESYKTTGNWSVLYSAGTCTFKAIEDYTVDGTIMGEIDWNKVKEPITFTIDEDSFTVRDGTTWKEFIDEQNPCIGGSFYLIHNDHVYYVDETGLELGYLYATYDSDNALSVYVNANEQIIANHNYVLA